MDKPIDLTTELRLCDHVMKREIDGSVVLLDLGNDKYFSVEGPAADFVDRIDSLTSIDTAVTELLAEYDTDRETLTADLQRLVGDLVDGGLLVEA